jgi:hypothetical protein
VRARMPAAFAHAASPPSRPSSRRRSAA